MGIVKDTKDTVWFSKKEGSNVLRVMNEKQAKEHMRRTGESVFTKAKKWKL